MDGLDDMGFSDDDGLPREEEKEPAVVMNHEEGIEATQHDLCVGQCFDTRESVKLCVSMHATKNMYAYKSKRDTDRSYFVKCKDSTCKWELKASTNSKREHWKIDSLVPHSNTCAPAKAGACRVTPKQLAAILLPQLRADPSYTPKTIITLLKDSYGINVDYQKAWRARKQCIETIRGNIEDSYKMARDVIQSVQERGPQNITELESKRELSAVLLNPDPDNPPPDVFHRCFIGLQAAAHCYKNQPSASSWDGGHLRGKYPGAILIATGRDANMKLPYNSPIHPLTHTTRSLVTPNFVGHGCYTQPRGFDSLISFSHLR